MAVVPVVVEVLGAVAAVSLGLFTVGWCFGGTGKNEAEGKKAAIIDDLRTTVAAFCEAHFVDDVMMLEESEKNQAGERLIANVWVKASFLNKTQTVENVSILVKKMDSEFKEMDPEAAGTKLDQSCYLDPSVSVEKRDLSSSGESNERIRELLNNLRKASGYRNHCFSPCDLLCRSNDVCSLRFNFRRFGGGYDLKWNRDKTPPPRSS